VCFPFLSSQKKMKKKKEQKNCRIFRFPPFFPSDKIYKKRQNVFQKNVLAKMFRIPKQKNMFAPTNWKQANWKVGLTFDAVSLHRQNGFSKKVQNKKTCVCLNGLKTSKLKSWQLLTQFHFVKKNCEAFGQKQNKSRTRF